MEYSNLQVTKAREIIRELMPVLQEAEQNFKSARNWGVVDILGGGLITNLIKHSKINNASSCMNQASYLLGQLQTVLSDLQMPSDYKMKLGGFSTFGDFVFDGAIFDIYMESKILSSLSTVQDLENRLRLLDDVLSGM